MRIIIENHSAYSGHKSMDDAVCIPETRIKCRKSFKEASSIVGPSVDSDFISTAIQDVSNDSPCVLETFDPWACDYCNIATFRTYEEACIHEQLCMMKKDCIKSASPRVPLLCRPKDKDCLSDRQCYVRSNFVELFSASESDVASRHSRGAQKLYVDQIGIRCIYCALLPQRDRAERAVCYPSSLSRIYQTVADMQRFHFDACQAIPESIKGKYRKFKTTRPRGVGSPQAYWIESAKEIGLYDTDKGIRYHPNIQDPKVTQHIGISHTNTNSLHKTRSSCPDIIGNISRDSTPSPLNHNDSYQNQGQSTRVLTPAKSSCPRSVSISQPSKSLDTDASRTTEGRPTASYSVRESDEAAMLLLLRTSHNIRQNCGGILHPEVGYNEAGRKRSYDEALENVVSHRAR